MTGAATQWAALRRDVTDTRDGALGPEDFSDAGYEVRKALARIRMEFSRRVNRCFPKGLRHG